MASMIMPEKKVFRARVLDPSKSLPVRFRQKCRTQSPKIKRAVAVPPSGMEKEEEMESHLQQAIYAQKATSAGVVVENHVIPTPKVSTIDESVYEKIYKKKSGRTKKLIVFKDFVSFFLNQSSYDADSDDEEWLNTRPNISIDQFEQIIFKLEMASQTDIIQPTDAKNLLHKYDSQLVDDVYDYWLQKRKQVASNDYKYSVLLPRLNTEWRREDRTINPYVAFRRRLDKVQTRKKQKTEIQTYEKILRLNYAMKRSLALVEMMKQREKAKLALVCINEAIFDKQNLIFDEENCELDRLTSEVLKKISTTKFCVPEVPLKKRMLISALPQWENGKFSLLFPLNKTKYSQRRKIRPTKIKKLFNLNDENIINEAWLKTNEELWNRITPTTAANSTSKASFTGANTTASFPSTILAENLNLICKYDVNSSIDGRYQFTRKFGCQYKAPTAMYLDPNRFPADTVYNKEQQNFVLEDEKSTQKRYKFYKFFENEPGFALVKFPLKKTDEDDYVNFWPVLRTRNCTYKSEVDDISNYRQFRNNDAQIFLLNSTNKTKTVNVNTNNMEKTSAETNCNNFLSLDILNKVQNNSVNNRTNIKKPNFVEKSLPSERSSTLGFIRRRMGRGGRVFYDLKF